MDEVDRILQRAAKRGEKLRGTPNIEEEIETAEKRMLVCLARVRRSAENVEAGGTYNLNEAVKAFEEAIDYYHALLFALDDEDAARKRLVKLDQFDERAEKCGLHKL